MNNFYKEKNSKLFFLLNKIKKQGYSNSINEFINKYPEFSYKFDKKQGGLAYRAISENNDKCLIINSDLGNIPEFFSNIFEEVVSLDIEEKILIQNERFKEKKIKNIKLYPLESNILQIEEKNFDLIILNDIKIKNYNSKKQVKKYLNHIKEFLSVNGCLCVSVGNKTGINITKDDNDDKYLDNFNGYNLLLNSLGLQINSYWALPSHNQAHYSGKIFDDTSLKWFFHNFDKNFFVDTKFKIIGIFLKILNKTLRKFFLLKFCPSFVFYCYLDELSTIEKMIEKKTNYDKIIQNIRSTKILYFLLNDNGIPKKVVTCKPIKYDSNEKIFEIKRNFPGMKIIDENITIENWLDGVPLDRFSENDTKLVMKWLKTFQNKTKSEFLDIHDIEQEIEQVKNKLDFIPEMSEIPYEKWLDEYKHEFVGKKIQKTAVHGDFQVRNILVDHKKLQVNVIDWDWRYEEKGNPIYDFIWLATNMMMLSKNYEKEFEYDDSQSNEVVKLIKIIENTMKDHLQVNFDFIKLQKFMILRFLTIRIKQGGNGHLLYIDILKILSKNTN